MFQNELIIGWTCVEMAKVLRYPPSFEVVLDMKRCGTTTIVYDYFIEKF
jgi:hypothetical protein